MTLSTRSRAVARFAVCVGLIGTSLGMVWTALAAPPAQDEIPAGSIVVRGRLQYTDRLGDKNHPAAGLKVEIWDLDGGFPATGEKLDETTTDAGGRFQSKVISNVDRDGPTGQRQGTQDLFLKLFSDNGHIRLLQTGTTQDYTWNSYEINARDGQLRDVPDGLVAMPPLFINENTKDIGALWTFVNLADAWLYLQAQTGKDPGDVTAYWSKTSQDGPRYDRTTKTLHFRDEDAGYAQRVIYYEAFALLENIFGALPDAWLPCIGTARAPLEKKEDAACALLHGLATTLPLVVYGNPEYETPDVSVIDLDKVGPDERGWDKGDTVPGRIAGAFWDLHENDRTDDGFDQFNATFGDIWSVFDAERPTTLPQWWEGWKKLGKDGCGAVGSLYQNTINYNTPPTITRVPDVIIDEEETATLNLANYVTDVECADKGFTFVLVEAGAPEAGITMTPEGLVTIAPAKDWFGETTVKVSVSDGLVTVEISFRVIVKPVNDCPTISPRIPDPEPVAYGEPVIVDLAPFAKDVDDGPGDLTWDVSVAPAFAKDLTIAGQGTSKLTFLLNKDIRINYSVLVKLTLKDRAGCGASQTIALFWVSAPNRRPTIDETKLTRAYTATVNTPITVDLTGVAEDPEDGSDLEWFVVNLDALNAQVKKLNRSTLDFEPDVGFIGSNLAELSVQDSGGARATAAITLTWIPQVGGGNVPPRILRSKLVGLEVGVNAEACYDLTDKAYDPDDSPESLRWYALDFDDTSLFVGAQGTRRMCLRSRPNFIGCQPATFLVRDPAGGEDRHEVTTCWKQFMMYLPFTVTARR
jgi:hypothetical protein